MAKLVPDTLPLLQLFERLRDLGFPLGTDNYLALRKALDAEYGLESENALERVCCLLWAKSRKEIDILQVEFRNVMRSESPADELSVDLKKKAKADGEAERTPPEGEEVREGETSQLDAQKAFPGETAFFPMFTSFPAFVSFPVEKRYDLSEYLPLSQREMKLGWRFLRRRVYDGPRVVLDVNETVQQSCKQGFYLSPVLCPRPHSDAHLTLFLDYGGSMVPFHRLINNLIITARDSGVFGADSENLKVYYFRNYPTDVLHADRFRTRPEPIDKALTSVSRHKCALIVSDAGAARGLYDPDRVDPIADFVFALKRVTPHLAWLNPLPQDRWLKTAASLIARMIPMYPMDHAGFYQAINALRGHPV